ncbi:dihydrolipoamide acetyltransferase family protein [Nocardia ninae]|uniref:Dihydrolipoamide acetyltransferase component of pyruvate dehydrogenase complex n=1 Tax=Nocardia ninae NBRC 108245 TaxID=1210091 RepID=A0A511M928_9NOCA|nr:dihydrolipoamide acetyltransferase family protein [Nocardia ninae]GEM37031.1 dihydrolipoamide acetyltransferase component of pyruvate dehydrogenase complex [Nocardia ninae NBRC 108245]
MEDRAKQPGNVLEFRLPDLGEGLADAELVSWSVAVGDAVELNQTIAEVETAKAVVALPSPFAGQVVELLAQPGETVLVGAPLIRVQNDEADAAPEQAGGANGAEVSSDAPGAGRTAVLVGYGPEGEAVSRRRRPVAAVTEADSQQAPNGTPAENRQDVAPQGESVDAPADSTESVAARSRDTTGDSEDDVAESVSDGTRPQLTTTRAAATPAARKLARELGIDLWFVAGSGPGGAVTVEDVRGAVPVSQPRTSASRPETAAAADTSEPAREVRTPISGVRKRTAAAMVASARTIPQASTFVTLDCTASMELIDHLRSTKAFAGLALTPLALVAKSALAALREFPGINTYWDEANQEIVTKHYVNLGLAVATERGLLVPNIKDAHSLSLRDLTREIGWLAETARSGGASPADLRGGTFTITNVGVFGVDTGVPLVNPGEAAILCLGSIRKRPWVFRDELAIRSVTTLGISFDHRMIDGELASRFLATVASLLEDPLTLLSRI